ncbi:M48 family metallopeptidase [Campylobacter jejuni]|nr:M48 family peptidase [Campylobacter jejuni]EAL0521614.1 M48 family metallopeptidase [Campylobacter jejuni]
MARQSSSLKSFIYKDECYFYSKKRIKTLRLRLNERGEFVLSIPYFCTFKNVYEFLDKSSSWMNEAKKRFEKKALKDDDVGGKIKCRKRKIKCRIFATNYLSFNLKLKL